MIIFAIFLFILFGVMIIGFSWSDSMINQHYNYAKEYNGNKIKFKTFALMYEMNPQAWECNGYICRYCQNGEFWNSHHSIIYTFYFNIFDFFKFQRFQKSLKKKKERERETAKAMEYLKLFKQDIANYEAKSKEKTNKELKDIWTDNYSYIKDKEGNIHIVTTKGTKKDIED